MALNPTQSNYSPRKQWPPPLFALWCRWNSSLAGCTVFEELRCTKSYKSLMLWSATRSGAAIEGLFAR